MRRVFVVLLLFLTLALMGQSAGTSLTGGNAVQSATVAQSLAAWQSCVSAANVVSKKCVLAEGLYTTTATVVLDPWVDVGNELDQSLIIECSGATIRRTAASATAVVQLNQAGWGGPLTIRGCRIEGFNTGTGDIGLSVVGNPVVPPATFPGYTLTLDSNDICVRGCADSGDIGIRMNRGSTGTEREPNLVMRNNEVHGYDAILEWINPTVDLDQDLHQLVLDSNRFVGGRLTGATIQYCIKTFNIHRTRFNFTDNEWYGCDQFDMDTHAGMFFGHGEALYAPGASPSTSDIDAGSSPIFLYAGLGAFEWRGKILRTAALNVGTKGPFIKLRDSAAFEDPYYIHISLQDQSCHWLRPSGANPREWIHFTSTTATHLQIFDLEGYGCIGGSCGVARNNAGACYSNLTDGNRATPTLGYNVLQNNTDTSTQLSAGKVRSLAQTETTAAGVTTVATIPALDPR